MPRRKRTEPTLETDRFLRSINITFDADHPDRIEHFQPTSKSVQLIQTLLDDKGERAILVTAPYGSGKSLVCSYVLHLLENRRESQSVLKVIARRIQEVSPNLGAVVTKRGRSRAKRGLVIVLSGHCNSIMVELADATGTAMRRLKLGREARPLASGSITEIGQLVGQLSTVIQKAKRRGIDQVVIFWDEFGRHIESLVAKGSTHTLGDLQTLAEYVSRESRVPVKLVLLLHQRLMYYASHLPQSVRREWAKIEGRFHSIQFVEDSKELNRLIAQIVTFGSNRITGVSNVANLVKKTQAANLFTEYKPNQLKQLLIGAYPLDPVTLHLLPRIAARVAQNERTLFSFLISCDLSKSIDSSKLYDFFSPSMQADTGLGGTYKQWLETESALAKVRGEPDLERALKIACLLSFGMGGERTSAGREALEFAISTYHDSDTRKVVDELIDRKLLLYRKHNNDVSVWHGTDVDLRARVEDQKDKLRSRFDLVSFLTKEAPPPVWRPLRHNDNFGIRRFFRAEFSSVEQLGCLLEEGISASTDEADGLICYVLADSLQELSTARELARSRAINPRIVVSLPHEPLAITEAALEVSALLQIQMDIDLLASDPLVAMEVQHMLDDSRSYLQSLLNRLFIPALGGPAWINKGSPSKISSPGELRSFLSKVMDAVYKQTPRVLNELVVRRKPSPIIVNARKKLLLGIMERCGQENFGIEGNFPDSSMCRTVLLHTGLYRKTNEGRWRFAKSHEISDPGLAAVWSELGEFLTAPDKEGKNFEVLFNRLSSPPFGVRPGLFPILLAAGFQAFPSARSIEHQGKYLTDILPSHIEDICRSPSNYTLCVLDIDQANIRYLEGILQLFSGTQKFDIRGSDLLRECYDALTTWISKLPSSALTTKNVSISAQRFQTVLRSIEDPVECFFRDLPMMFGVSLQKYEQLLIEIRRAKDELDAVRQSYMKQARDSVRRIFSFLGEPSESLNKTVRRWASCFPEEFVTQSVDGVGQKLIMHLQGQLETDEHLLQPLSILITGKPFIRWDDGTQVFFERELRDMVHRIEDLFVSSSVRVTDAEITDNFVRLATGRMWQLKQRLVQLVGEEASDQLLMNTIRERSEGNGIAKRRIKQR